MTDYGGSEGIYIDISVKWYNEFDKKNVIENFITGKTLGKTDSDMDRMNLIASAVTKALYSHAGEHDQYIRFGNPEKPENSVLHFNGAEQRLLINSLVETHSRMKSENQPLENIENLLRRVTGSITEYINEVGQRPAELNDYDMTILAIHDGNLPAFIKTFQNTPDKIGELLAYAAGRSGTVGRKMTEQLLTEANGISSELYSNACKNAINTGDLERTLLMARQAETCVAEPDMSLYGDMMIHALYEHKQHIADGILEQCSPEQIKESKSHLLPQAIRSRNHNMAIKLVEKGINANPSASELIHALTYHGNDRGYLDIFFKRGMNIDNNNYSAMAACIKTESPEQAKLLLDRGMDFLKYTEWAETNWYGVKDGETFEAVKAYWENEVKTNIKTKQADDCINQIQTFIEAQAADGHITDRHGQFLFENLEAMTQKVLSLSGSKENGLPLEIKEKTIDTVCDKVLSVLHNLDASTKKAAFVDRIKAHIELRSYLGQYTESEASILSGKVDTLNNIVSDTFQQHISIGDAIREACKEVLSESRSLTAPEKPPAQEKPSILKTVEENKSKISQAEQGQPDKQKKREPNIE